MKAKAEQAPVDDLTPNHLQRHSDWLREAAGDTGCCAGFMLWVMTMPVLALPVTRGMASLRQISIYLPLVILAYVIFYSRTAIINRLLDGLHDHVAEVIKTNARLADLDLVRDDLTQHLDGMKARNRQINFKTRVIWLTDNYVRFCREHHLPAYPPAWRRVLRIATGLAIVCCVWVLASYLPDEWFPWWDVMNSPGGLLLYFGPFYTGYVAFDLLVNSAKLRSAVVLQVYAGLLREEQPGGTGAAARDEADG